MAITFAPHLLFKTKQSKNKIQSKKTSTTMIQQFWLNSSFLKLYRNKNQGNLYTEAGFLKNLKARAFWIYWAHVYQ